MTVPELPLEIWEQIAGFLPRTFVQTLYSVNRPLLGIALNLRYSVAIIDAFTHRDAERTLLNPNIRARARRVVVTAIRDTLDAELCSHSVCHLIHQDHVTRGKPPGKIQQVLTKLHLLGKKSQFTAPVQIDHYYDQMMNLVQNMDHIRELKFKVTSTRDGQFGGKLQLTKAILGVPSSRISKLDLNCPMDILHRVLTPGLVIPSLSTLRLTLRLMYTLSGVTETFDSLQLFLQNHRSSLQSLDICFARMNTPSDFLRRLPKFPALSNLVLIYHPSPLFGDIFTGMKYFISAHKSQLRSMTLVIRPHRFVNMEPYYDLAGNIVDLALLDFPNLQHLTLGVLSWSILDSISLKQYPQPHQNTLTSLQLFSDMGTYTEFQQAFSSLTLNLKRLACNARCLSPTLLSLFAVTFLTLEELVINVRCKVASEPDYVNDPNTIPPFLHDLPKAIEALRGWNLHAITLIPHGQLKQISIRDRVCIVSALPQVRSFCDVTPDEYATAKDDPGILLKEREDCWGAGFDLAQADAAITTHTCYM